MCVYKHVVAAVVEVIKSWIILLQPHGLYSHQAPLSYRFSRQGYWRGLQFPSTGDLPDPGIKPRSHALTGGFLYPWVTWEAPIQTWGYCICTVWAHFVIIVKYTAKKELAFRNCHYFKPQSKFYTWQIRRMSWRIFKSNKQS